MKRSEVLSEVIRKLRRLRVREEVVLIKVERPVVTLLVMAKM